MKRLASLAALLLGGAACFLWFAQSFALHWEPRVRSVIENRLSDALHARVRIDRISIRFIHRIALENVEIYDTQKTPPLPTGQAGALIRESLIARVKTVSLTVSLVDLPGAIARHRPVEAIGLVSLDSPWIVLSPDRIPSGAASNRKSIPVLFTLAWNNGTFQWKDPTAPHGAWTLYQSHGAFRIRGPRISLDLKGGFDPLQQADLHVSAIGHRWSAAARLTGIRLPELIALWTRQTGKPPVPPGWTVNGQADVAVTAQGPWPLRHVESWSVLRHGDLTFRDVRLTHGVAPPLRLSGGLSLTGTTLDLAPALARIAGTTFHLDGTVRPFGASPEIQATITSRDLDLSALTRFASGTETPVAEGVGSAAVFIRGPLQDPEITVKGAIPRGQLLRHYFENAVFQVRRVLNHWELGQNQVSYLGGQVQLTGSVSPDNIDLRLTGQDLSLAHLAQGKTPLQGRAHFAIVAHGTMESPRTTGSFWIDRFSWGTPQTFSLRGRLETSAKHFSFQAASDDNAFHLQTEGTRDEDSAELQSFVLHLPSGADFTANGTVDTEERRAGIAWTARNVSLADDLPDVHSRWPLLSGRADADGRIEGPLDDLTCKATAHSDGLRWDAQVFQQAAAAIVVSRGQVFVPNFSIDPGYQGSWHSTPGGWALDLAFDEAPVQLLTGLVLKDVPLRGTAAGKIALQKNTALIGEGDLSLEEGSWGTFAFSHAEAAFHLREKTLAFDRFLLDAPTFHARLHGRASWPSRDPLLSVIHFKCDGQLSTPEKEPVCSFPFALNGDLDPRDGWRGRADLFSKALLFRGAPTDSVSGRFVWEPHLLRWENFRWGNFWKTNGQLYVDGDRSELSGQADGSQIALARWETLLWPKLKEPLSGFLSTHLALSGTLADPKLDFSTHAAGGKWREFRFDADATGQWTRKGIEPITASGRLLTGGKFQFNGHIWPGDGTAGGSLAFTDFNLQPLGASLAFPHPLSGQARGTLTVSGPLTQLRLAGHLEGGPLQYGTAPAPLRLQTCSVDMILAPAPDLPGVTRLTITRATAKTLEEEIRVNPDSFMEFSPGATSRFKVGTEIRNVHLSLFTLFGGSDIEGTWEIRPEGFALTGDVYTRSLFINDYQLEEGHANLSYYNGVLAFSPPRAGKALVTGAVDFHRAPEIHFTNFFISGKEGLGLNITGDMGPALWNFQMDGDGLDLGALGGLAGFPYPLEGTASINVQGRGNLKNPQMNGEISVEDGKALALHFTSGNAAFSWENHRITFTRLTLTDPDRYTLIGAGVFPLGSSSGSPQEIDFSLRLKDSNLGLLKSLVPEVKEAHGPLQGLLQIKGTPAAPQLRGSFHVRNGQADGVHYFRHLRDFQMSADFSGDQLVLHDFRGRSGNGEFVGNGTVSFVGFEPKAYDLELQIPSPKGIDVEVPELAIPESPLAKKFHFLTTASRSEVTGHVTFKGPAEAPVFAGEATISNGHFTFPPSSKQPPSPGLIEWIRRVQWDATLKFGEGAWFENELVEANLVGSLRLAGPSDKLRVDGGMDIPEGKISYLGVEFDIRQARFEMRSSESGPGILNTPYIRGIGDSKVQTIDPITGLSVDDTISLTIDYAPINEIKPRLVSASDPTLAQDKVLARVSQLDTQKLTPQERTYLYQQQMVRLLDTSLATPLARNLLKRTGLVDQVSVSRVINPTNAPTPEQLAATSSQQQTAVNLLAGTKYTLEKNLSSRLSLGYGVRFEEVTSPALVSRLDLRSDVELSYHWMSNIYLKGSFDLPNSTPGYLPENRVTIEPRWRFGWWGNTNKNQPKTPPKTPAPLLPPS